MHFLVRYGFVVPTGRLKWIVRKPLTADDVDEACALLRLAYAPMLPRETPFDILRRVRAAGYRNSLLVSVSRGRLPLKSKTDGSGMRPLFDSIAPQEIPVKPW